MDLDKEIRQTIKRLIDESRYGMLNEMAYKRNVYKEKVDNILPQIFENWCLVHYCTITGRTQTKFHWSDELYGHMLTISRYGPKGNNSADARMKVLNEIINDGDYDKPNILHLTITRKFENEKINIYSTEYQQTINDCITAFPEIIQIITSQDSNRIRKYTEVI